MKLLAILMTVTMAFTNFATAKDIKKFKVKVNCFNKSSESFLKSQKSSSGSLVDDLMFINLDGHMDKDAQAFADDQKIKVKKIKKWLEKRIAKDRCDSDKKCKGKIVDYKLSSDKSTYFASKFLCVKELKCKLPKAEYEKVMEAKDSDEEVDYSKFCK